MLMPQHYWHFWLENSLSWVANSGLYSLDASSTPSFCDNQKCLSFQLLSHVPLFVTPWSQHARPPCPSPTPGVHSNSRPSSQWCHPAISSSVVSFSSCPQSFFSNESAFASGGQSIGVSASTSVLPMNNQDWSPSEWTGWISLQSKGLSRVFSNTTVQKHQFFGAQLSL